MVWRWRRIKILGLIWLAVCLAGAPAPGLGQTATAPARPAIYEFARPDCPVCARMRVILEGIKARYPGRLEVLFFSFERDDYLFKQFRVTIVPTQVFLDESGREVFRHEGLLPEDQLLVKLKELKFIHN